jgi:DNA-binding CsgD family transcriptional regulator
MADAILDPRLMELWEQVRRSPRPITLRAVAAACATDAVDALARLDRLTELGMLERVAAARGNAVRWRTSVERLVAVFADEDRALVAELMRRVPMLQQELFDSVVARFSNPDPDPKAAWKYLSAGTVRLQPDDLPELLRRIRSVHEFIELVGKRRHAGGPAQAGYSNHAILIRVEPLTGPVLPQPDINLVRKSVSDRRIPASAAHGRHQLSPREVEVAQALATGLTRAEVAKALGVTANTVGTLSTRIYRKLGVKTRLQLARAIGMQP